MRSSSAVSVLLLCLARVAMGQATSTSNQPPTGGPPRLASNQPVLGRWNLRMLGATRPGDVYSSWLEIERSGFVAVVGRFVGLIGGARPIGSIELVNDSTARFTIPTEWEVPSGDLRFEIRVTGDSLTGTMVSPPGTSRAFVGKRAPILLRAAPTAWSAPTALFNGKDLSGWTVAPTRPGTLPSRWKVRDGLLVNDGREGANLMTVQRYDDFKLHAEFRLPTGGTSGIFPRGRYWVILGDKPDSVPFKGTTGAVHRFLVPSQDAARGTNIWHSIDITMVGRRITVVVNGTTVLANQIIPGITGSAIDGDEAAPGPIMLQGEERPVEFRNITIRVPRMARGAPAREARER